MTINRSPEQPGRYSYACLLRLPEVMNRTGLSRSEIYRRIGAGSFPSMVKLSERASAWDSREIDRWVLARIAARDAKAAA